MEEWVGKRGEGILGSGRYMYVYERICQWGREKEREE